jgi:hypothetical protein
MRQAKCSRVILNYLVGKYETPPCYLEAWFIAEGEWLLLADLRLMRLRTADVAANVCIRDERGAVADPKRTSALAFAHPQSKFRRAYPTPPPDSWVC